MQQPVATRRTRTRTAALAALNFRTGRGSGPAEHQLSVGYRDGRIFRTGIMSSVEL